MGFRKILVAIDYSQLTQSVFDQALKLALLTQGSLMLLHCLSRDLIGEPVVPTSVELGLSPELIDNCYEMRYVQVEKQMQQGQAMLRRYCETATNQGVPTDFNEPVGEAGPCLCQTAKNWGADLIVLGRRGRTGLAEALLGSVSNYVLHHAPCSILVVQANQASEPTARL